MLWWPCLLDPLVYMRQLLSPKHKHCQWNLSPKGRSALVEPVWWWILSWWSSWPFKEKALILERRFTDFIPCELKGRESLHIQRSLRNKTWWASSPVSIGISIIEWKGWIGQRSGSLAVVSRGFKPGLAWRTRCLNQAKTRSAANLLCLSHSLPCHWGSPTAGLSASSLHFAHVVCIHWILWSS